MGKLSPVTVYATVAINEAVNAAGIPEDQIKPPSALLIPGAENNSNMIVRETTGKLMAYVWSADDNEWSVLGEVMDRPEDTMNVPKKVCANDVTLEPTLCMPAK